MSQLLKRFSVERLRARVVAAQDYSYQSSYGAARCANGRKSRGLGDVVGFEIDAAGRVVEQDMVAESNVKVARKRDQHIFAQQSVECSRVASCGVQPVRSERTSINHFGHCAPQAQLRGRSVLRHPASPVELEELNLRTDFPKIVWGKPSGNEVGKEACIERHQSQAMKALAPFFDGGCDFGRELE
jgi:hypothetical protein